MSINDRLAALAECLCAELGDLCFCGILPGAEVPLDYAQHDCSGSDCGMAWLRVATAYPSRVIGQPDDTPGNCAYLLGWEVEMAVVRCIATADDRGNPPDPALMLAASQVQMEDMLAMRRAVVCCNDVTDFVLGTYTPYGPEGGLYGGAWVVGMAE